MSNEWVSVLKGILEDKIPEEEASDEEKEKGKHTVLQNTGCIPSHQKCCSQSRLSIWIDTYIMSYSETSLIQHSMGPENNVGLEGCWIMKCLLPYLSMVTVLHIMVGLERMLDYRGFTVHIYKYLVCPEFCLLTGISHLAMTSGLPLPPALQLLGHLC